MIRTRRPAVGLVGLVALVISLVMTVARAQEPTGDAPLPAFNPVTPERLVNADAEPHNWLMYSGNYSAQRYSGLDQIHRHNVAALEVAWVHQLRVLDQAETTPLVVDGVMFITESPSTVIAVDAASGRPYWRYEHQLPDELIICCGPQQPRRRGPR